MEPENQLTSTLHSNIAQPAIGVVQTFEEKLLRKNLKYNIEEKQDEYETVKKSGGATFALVVKDWDCLWKWTQQQQLLFHF